MTTLRSSTNVALVQHIDNQNIALVSPLSIYCAMYMHTSYLSTMFLQSLRHRPVAEADLALYLFNETLRCVGTMVVLRLCRGSPPATLCF